MLFNTYDDDEEEEEEESEEEEDTPHRSSQPDVTLRDVGRTVGAETMSQLERLGKSERATNALDTSVALAVDALDDPNAAGERIRAQATKIMESERVVALRQKGQDLLHNALRDDESRERAKRAAHRALDVTEALARSAYKHGAPVMVAGTITDAAQRLKEVISNGKDRESMIQEGKNLAKDVWARIQDQAKESESLRGMKETVERIVARVKV